MAKKSGKLKEKLKEKFLDMSVAMTEVQRRTLVALVSRPCGPAYLSGLVWPGHISLRKGAAPGTGLVRPMLAILARLKKQELVRWYSPEGTDPVVWEVTLKGRTELEKTRG